ncbi:MULTISPECIES: DNA polymerase III subunit theta [Serratia]|uniref:DNA polymerase III subunit theta n=1 Tax=Serratia TaxID=613 RepID=UPI00077C216F|nr:MULTISPECIES: DNA polymerase III subunit theta [Serratia]CAI0736209.1 DNA polymerase III subunit theta [Serratia ficaria]CAI0996101.1 DNA polymerase III subunit theta [Serratia ficaria]CAI1586737.1 DNA polymerase III subunit theta [Serratia ficaria]CAI1602514.1 DNA polymerase III subunit theta [Serratia ficaria]CAI1692063.1 DNA polymerase III subunit theta [Serratia ficaria]
MSLYYRGYSGNYVGKLHADIAASCVAGKERLNLPVTPALVEAEQPEHLRHYFKQRLEHYRQVAQRLPPEKING